MYVGQMFITPVVCFPGLYPRIDSVLQLRPRRHRGADLPESGRPAQGHADGRLARRRRARRHHAKVSSQGRILLMLEVYVS